MAGQVWLAGKLGTVAFGKGEAMILIATLLWSVEIVFVKYLLRSIPPSVVAAARMAVGTVLLLCWLALAGKLGDLVGLSALQWRWALLTGLLLTAYVATWFAALARAQAIDVTAVLVFGAFVTAILSGVIDGAAIGVGGSILIAVGSGLVAWTALRRSPTEAAS
jgi:drug/metabolite transporter (DMT)-like permease